MSTVHARDELPSTNFTPRLSLTTNETIMSSQKSFNNNNNNQNTIRQVKPIKASQSIESNDSFSRAQTKRTSFAATRQQSVDDQKAYIAKSLEAEETMPKKIVLNDRKLAGFWQQFAILSWKNLILSRRNVCGLITEIACPIFIVIILVVIRYFVDASRYDDQTNGLYNVLDIFPLSNTTKQLLYYPNNTFIRGIVDNAVAIIKTRKPAFTPTGYYRFFLSFLSPYSNLFYFS
jgi:hypothetical protein